MQATKDYIEKHGIPHEVYVDFGGVFSVNNNNADRFKKTQWERAMEELNIKVSHAHSAQAKGRVERANGTLQDWLTMELRQAGISSIDAANHFLRESNFIAEHNERVAEKPEKEGDAHRPQDLFDLDNIFCIKEERVLANDYTIVFNKRIFQLHSSQRTIIRPKDKITVNVDLNGLIKLTIRKTNLEFTEIHARTAKPLPEEKIIQHKSYKVSENSRRWASGLAPKKENRVKLALPAMEAKEKRN